MPEAVAITIGNFDGVHLGHARLVGMARQAAGPAGRVIVLSFDPHPLAVLRPQLAPGRLSTAVQRSEQLVAAGADQVVIIPPTTEFLKQSPRQFVESIVARFHPRFIVEGGDFRFGSQRSGSTSTLRELEQEFGYRTIVLDDVDAPLVDQSMVRVSSTLIRWLLVRGRVSDASRLLGRTYELMGTVVSGDRRGRTIGVPTANLEIGDLMLPADGIYAGSGGLPDGSRFAAAISVGTKPTFGSHPRTCEAYLIGYRGALDQYGWTLRLHFDRWLRDQVTYSGVDQLVDQLRRDIQRSTEPAPGVGVDHPSAALAATVYT